MKIVYGTFNIYEQFDQAISQAKADNKRIKEFVVTRSEFEEFIELGNDPDQIFAGYTTKMNPASYEKEYLYKNIVARIAKTIPPAATRFPLRALSGCDSILSPKIKVMEPMR